MLWLNKRLPSLVGIFPGRYRKPHKPRVFAVIDTSGSITEQLLSAINREVARVAREFEVIVAECDSKVHAIYPYREIKEVRGRGGTNLQAPFAPEILSQVGEFSVLIYFTDGYGPAPPRAPRFPVIWCIVPGGIAPANWGRVIEMGAP